VSEYTKEAAGRRARQGRPVCRRVSCGKEPEGYTAAPGAPDIRLHRRSKCVPHVPHSRRAARRECPDLLVRAATVPPGDETSPRERAFLPQLTRSLLLPVGGAKRFSSNASILYGNEASRDSPVTHCPEYGVVYL